MKPAETSTAMAPSPREGHPRTGSSRLMAIAISTASAARTNQSLPNRVSVRTFQTPPPDIAS